MKNLIKTLIVSLLSINAFAQKTFTEETFNTVMGGYKKDPANFLRNEVAKDFNMINLGGKTVDAPTIAGWNDAATENNNEWSNVKVRQYGTTAVVSCDWKQSHHWKTGDWLRFSSVTKSVFTYQNNKWVLVSWDFFFPDIDKNTQEAAIKAVIEKETQTWQSRDAEGMASCWANVPYALQLVYHGTPTNGGVAYSTNAKKDMAEGVKAIVASMGKPDGSTFKNENYVIQIKNNGYGAFAYFDQTVTNANGTKDYFHEARYLENVNDEWKLVYVGAVKYDKK